MARPFYVRDFLLPGSEWTPMPKGMHFMEFKKIENPTLAQRLAQELTSIGDVEHDVLFVEGERETPFLFYKEMEDDGYALAFVDAFDQWSPGRNIPWCLVAGALFFVMQFNQRNGYKVVDGNYANTYAYEFQFEKIRYAL